jgi:hypothetical protein
MVAAETSAFLSKVGMGAGGKIGIRSRENLKRAGWVDCPCCARGVCSGADVDTGVASCGDRKEFPALVVGAELRRGLGARRCNELMYPSWWIASLFKEDTTHTDNGLCYSEDLALRSLLRRCFFLAFL